MSARATAWAHAQRVGNSVRKLVLLAVADACNDEGFGYPSIARIAWMAECSERTVQRSLQDLEAGRFLQVDRERDRANGSRSSNGYQLTMAAPRLPLMGGDNLSPRQSVTPSERHPVSCVTPTELPPSSKEVFICKGESKAKKQKPTTIPPDFEISDRVRAWAVEKRFDQLEQHLEGFVSTCRAKGYAYVDWDEAFMNAVRKDWAQVRKAPDRGGGSRRENAVDRNRRAAEEFVRGVEGSS